MKNKFLLILAICLLACGCAQRSSKQAAQTRQFSIPQVPSILAGDYEWIAVHYFDHVADTANTAYLCDSTHIYGIAKEEFEQKFANYVAYVLPAVPRNTATESIRAFYSKTGGNPVALDIARHYLYDPNSPWRDEDIFADLLRLSEPSSPEIKRCDLSRVGTIAPDFEYYDKRGRTHTLHGTHAVHTILVFGNLECHACKEIKEAFEGHALLQSLIDSKAVALIDIPVDDDLSEWDDMYHIRAIPSVYLMDADKRIIFKDCTTEKLLNFIENEYR